MKQHALKAVVSDRDTGQPDALARYRLPPGDIAASPSGAAGHGFAAFAGEVWSTATRVIAILQLWRERAHSRKSLSGLDERMLRDIGISSSQLWHEANKPFWRD